MTRKIALLATVAALVMAAVFSIPPSQKESQAAGKAAKGTNAKQYLANIQKGDAGLKSIGSISFGPNGILLIAATHPSSPFRPATSAR